MNKRLVMRIVFFVINFIFAMKIEAMHREIVEAAVAEGVGRANFEQMLSRAREEKEGISQINNNTKIVLEKKSGSFFLLGMSLDDWKNRLEIENKRKSEAIKAENICEASVSLIVRLMKREEQNLVYWENQLKLANRKKLAAITAVSICETNISDIERGLKSKEAFEQMKNKERMAHDTCDTLAVAQGLTLAEFDQMTLEHKNKEKQDINQSKKNEKITSSSEKPELKFRVGIVHGNRGGQIKAKL